MRKILLATAVALILAQGTHAAEPRIVAAAVADRIAAEYFDPKRGAEIAAELKAEAAKGVYDRYREPLDLAQALTARLRPLDGHFSVSWRAPSPTGTAGPTPRPTAAPQGVPARRLEADRRANHGFHQVSVLPGNIGLIDMRYFADLSGAGQASQATADAALALVAGTEAVIFDLRDNGGGSPGMVGYMVSHFVPEDAAIYNTFKGRGPDQHETPPAKIRGARRLETPLYVVVSARTASAAEAFAYTLKAAGRATIVGEATAGAANPGGPVQAGDGFSVFVPFGRPVNPITGGNWEGTGVAPDVAVPAAEALTRARVLALEAVLKGGLEEPAATETRWALEALAPAAPAELADYAGTYGVRSVAVEDGRLRMRQGRRPPLTLKPLSADLFAVEDAFQPSRVRFERGGDGKVIALVVMDPAGRQARFAASGS